MKKADWQNYYSKREKLAKRDARRAIQPIKRASRKYQQLSLFGETK